MSYAENALPVVLPQANPTEDFLKTLGATPQQGTASTGLPEAVQLGIKENGDPLEPYFNGFDEGRKGEPLAEAAGQNSAQAQGAALDAGLRQDADANATLSGQRVGELDEGAGELSGPVEITPPLNATSEQIAQTKAYIEGSNQALQAGKLSPTGRVSTAGSLRIRASASAAKERARAAAAGTPYQGHVGHVPDTTWTGTADPYSWLDLDPSVNMSIGGQANRYPIGYKPTEFRFKDR